MNRSVVHFTCPTCSFLALNVRPLARAAATASILGHAPFLSGVAPRIDAAPAAAALAAATVVAELELARDPGFWSNIDDLPAVGGSEATADGSHS